MLDSVRPEDIAATEAAQNAPTSRPSPVVGFVRGAFRVLAQIVLMVAVLTGAFVAMNKLIDQKPESKKHRSFRTVYTVDAIPVKFTDHQPIIVSYGQITAARTVDLRSLVSGEVISANANLRTGAVVEPGEILVVIDDFNFRGALKEAEANLAEYQARVVESRARINSEQAKLISIEEQLSFADNDLTRALSLRKQGTLTQQQVEIRRLTVSQRGQAVVLSKNSILIEQARLKQQIAALERLNWRVSQAAQNLKNTSLKAPFRGIVRTSSVEQGKLVNANDVIVSLYEEGKFDVKFTLTDAQFGRIQADKPGLVNRQVEVIRNVGGREFTYFAIIDRIGADITSDRGGVEVFAKLTDPGPAAVMRPGAFVEIKVPDQMFKSTARIPDTAIYEGKFVYVLDEGKLTRREVEIAAFDGEFALIRSGISANERVLTTRIAEVGAGLNVRESGSAPPPSKNIRKSKKKISDSN